MAPGKHFIHEENMKTIKKTKCDSLSQHSVKSNLDCSFFRVFFLQLVDNLEPRLLVLDFVSISAVY